MNEHSFFGATVLVTSKDRSAVLVKALKSISAQTVNCEIIVIDDGSSDDTSEVVRRKFPTAILYRNESPLGIIKARNQGFAMATKDIVFTLDDDAEFSDTRLVENVLKDFRHPFVGAVTIPLTDHFEDGSKRVRMTPEQPTGDFLCSAVFSGGANAIRRNLFLDIGGYIGDGRQGEERGVALRMIDQGYFVKVGDSFHINHFPDQPGKASKYVDFYNMKNSIVFGWRLVPMPYLIAHIAGTVANHFILGAKKLRLLQPLAGLAAGIAYGFSSPRQRQPVSVKSYRCFRHLVSLNKYRRSALEAAALRFSIERRRTVPSNRPSDEQ